MKGWIDGWLKREKGTVGKEVAGGNEGCNGCME